MQKELGWGTDDKHVAQQTRLPGGGDRQSCWSVFGGEEGRMFQVGHTTHAKAMWPACVQCVHLENQSNCIHLKCQATEGLKEVGLGGFCRSHYDGHWMGGLFWWWRLVLRDSSRGGDTREQCSQLDPPAQSPLTLVWVPEERIVIVGAGETSKS